jgi:hypothetical protein
MEIFPSPNHESGNSVARTPEIRSAHRKAGGQLFNRFISLKRKFPSKPPAERVCT